VNADLLQSRRTDLFFSQEICYDDQSDTRQLEIKQLLTKFDNLHDIHVACRAYRIIFFHGWKFAQTATVTPSERKYFSVPPSKRSPDCNNVTCNHVFRGGHVTGRRYVTWFVFISASSADVTMTSRTRVDNLMLITVDHSQQLFLTKSINSVRYK